MKDSNMVKDSGLWWLKWACNDGNYSENEKRPGAGKVASSCGFFFLLLCYSYDKYLLCISNNILYIKYINKYNINDSIFCFYFQQKIENCRFSSVQLQFISIFMVSVFFHTLSRPLVPVWIFHLHFFIHIIICLTICSIFF